MVSEYFTIKQTWEKFLQPGKNVNCICHHSKKIAVLKQRCKTCIRFILHILYYKEYNSSCSLVGHNLINRVKSSPKQIKITASICKHILCEDGSAAYSGIDASML